jgi:SAM-dependent methyltransferase
MARLILSPWRWKRTFIGLVDQIVGSLDDLRTKLQANQESISDGSEKLEEVHKTLAAMEMQLAHQSDEIFQGHEEFLALRQKLVGADTGGNSQLEPHLEYVRNGLSQLKRELEARAAFGIHDVARQLNDQEQRIERVEQAVSNLSTQLGQVQGSLAEQNKWLEKISLETNNLIMNLDSSLHTRLNTLQNLELPRILEQINEAIARPLRVISEKRDRSTWRACPNEKYVAANAAPFDVYIDRAQSDFPNLFAMWHERLKATLDAFMKTKVGNAANPLDPYSTMFRDFVETYVEGRVLDVGCGVFGRPHYLSDYPCDLISGLDPLPMREPANFEFVQGIGEYLPWPDGSFSTLISATSLDHCICLERCIAEMVRVVRPGGRVLLWIGSLPGSPKFEPNRPDFLPADEYHLFHFDKAWFEPVLEEAFEFIDRIELRCPGYSHIFYCCRPKDDAGVLSSSAGTK